MSTDFGVMEMWDLIVLTCCAIQPTMNVEVLILPDFEPNEYLPCLVTPYNINWGGHLSPLGNLNQSGFSHG